MYEELGGGGVGDCQTTWHDMKHIERLMNDCLSKKILAQRPDL
jgi:hypothetical protein